MLFTLAVLTSAATIDGHVRMVGARQGGKPAPSAIADRDEAGTAGLAVLRQGWEPVRGETLGL